MKTEKFQLDLVSSYFVRGASNNANSKPELRAPAFRGVLRYWFRAVAGGVIGERALDDIKKLETAVFGSTDSGSPIRLRVVQKELIHSIKLLLPGDQRTKRESFDPNQTFTVIISANANVSETVWDAFLSIFRVFVAFGGAGVRARRGYGAFQFSHSPLRDTEHWKTHVTSVAQNALTSIRVLAETFGITVQPTLATGPSRFPCLNKICYISLGNTTYGSAQSAIDGFMVGHTNHSWLGFIGGEGHDRQSSPLWLKPVKIGDRYRLQYVVLASVFPGNDYLELNKFVNARGVTNLSIPGWNA
jgi:CRISPR-associated protein Cmr1